MNKYRLNEHGGGRCELRLNGHEYTVRVSPAAGRFCTDVWVWKVNGCIGRGNPVAVWLSPTGPTYRKVLAAALFPGGCVQATNGS